MTVKNRLVRSVPFWTLVVLSVAAIGAGAYVLADKLGTMERTIVDGTATGVEVYVGQVWAVFGAILVGAGVLGLALALAVAAARALVPAAPAPVDTRVSESDVGVEPVALLADTATPAETVTVARVEEPEVPVTGTTSSTDASDAPARSTESVPESSDASAPADATQR
ncbi:MAG: dinucleotide-utilizing enzyme [Microbacterium arborescens]